VAYRAIRAALDLAMDVECLWELAGPAALLQGPVFPDGRAEIVLHLTPPPRARGCHAPQPRLMVAGQMHAAVHLEADGFVHVVGVRFTPLGARRWLQAPMHLFADRFLPLADVRPELASRLEAAAGERQPLHGVERALRETMRAVTVPDAVRWAADAAMRSGGRLKVEALARGAGCSRRQLERQFLDQVGLTPKAMLRTARLQRALVGLSAGAAAARVAAACGFADQAHLSREIRRVAGVSPRDVEFSRVPFLSDLS
jgi:AraC-like DNA-binding protein